MNWPALTPECSQAIAEVLKDAVQQRPKDLFGMVAAELERKSGIDPAEFANFFAECKQKPRKYVLEDRCPAEENPFDWVPMRYNDDTILHKLQNDASELFADIMSTEELPSGRELFDRASQAYPELSYLRDSPQEVEAMENLRGLALCCSGFPGALEEESGGLSMLEDADASLTFRCASLLAGVREHLLTPVAFASQEGMMSSIEKLEALMVFQVLCFIGQNQNFRQHYGFTSDQDPQVVAVAAVDNFIEAVPSFGRLPQASKVLIKSVLQAYVPFCWLLHAEALPVHFLSQKEWIAKTEGGLLFALAAAALQYIPSQRTVQAPPETQDLIRVVGTCLPNVEKNSASRAYELYLRKRAERHQWRLMRDDFMHRSIIRLCCMVGIEKTSTWNEIEALVESLSDKEKQVLKSELGEKDGIACVSGYVLTGISKLLAQVFNNERLNLRSGVRLVIRLLEALVQSYDGTGMPVIQVDLEALIARARDYSGGPLLEDTPMTFRSFGQGRLANEMLAVQC
eukprot:TRINITY_DN13913_c0_g1_i1.p1 TRINITY_DN13913_c0_g1~~TRINITY_DN13913_c0_g1_i1.p1  ORF type:complete len:514 (+),score=131.01 TRINITY_DN13913_c0_g1_i1:76-1617(+)